MSAPIRIRDDVEYIVWRLLQQALNEATPMHWERVAEMYERWPSKRNDLIARNCRNHAKLLREQYAERTNPEFVALVADVADLGATPADGAR